MFISLLPNSVLWIIQMVSILLFWFAEKYNRTKVTSHTNDVNELFVHVDTPNA